MLFSCRVYLGLHPGVAQQRSLFPGLPGSGGFPASLLFGTSFGGLIMAAAVPQIQGLAPLITAVGSRVSSSRKSRNSSRLVPSQSRVCTHLWKCKAPQAQRHKRRGGIPHQNGITGIQIYLRCKNTSPELPQIALQPQVSLCLQPIVPLHRVGWEGLGSSTSI